MRVEKIFVIYLHKAKVVSREKKSRCDWIYLGVQFQKKLEKFGKRMIIRQPIDTTTTLGPTSEDIDSRETTKTQDIDEHSYIHS